MCAADDDPNLFSAMSSGARRPDEPRTCTISPKPRVLIKRLDKGEIRNTVVTRATMYDNPHLPTHIKGDLEETYGGTALGAQELLGRVVEQDENALWKRENLERDR